MNSSGKYIFDSDLLDKSLEESGATLIGDYEWLNQGASIKYTCKCGNNYEKKFCSIVYYGGAYCKQCTIANKAKKIKTTCKERYGVENPSQYQEVKDKKTETSMKNFGMHPLQCPEIQEKRKKLHLEKYGVENPSQREEIKEKIKNVFIEKYGGYPAQSQEIRDKIKATCFEKYGGYPAESEEVKIKAKATFMKNMGCYPLQSKEVMEKSQKNGKRYKDYIMPSGTIRRIQGYEHFALNELVKIYTEDQIKSDRKDIPRIEYYKESNKDKKCYYFPDIYIPHENKIIEVKSTWTYSSKIDGVQEKAKYTRKEGYIYEIWVYDNKGVKVEVC